MAKEYDEHYTVTNNAYKRIIRDYVKEHLLEPLKKYPTTISDTLLYVIISRLEELYVYTCRFPEIISPDSNRLDILRAIVDQFEFTIRNEADIEEQISILENILHVYNLRGSVDSIENMWKYYGGDLPKDVKVKIPSYNIFRYNISSLSGSHVFQDADTYRSGVYEIVLNNSTYSIPDLREFLLNELVAAGNRIYFTNSLYSLLTGDNAAYKYDVEEDTFIHTMLRTVNYRSGMSWSGSGRLSSVSQSSIWSGREDLFFELTNIINLDLIDLSTYLPYDIMILETKTEYIIYTYDPNEKTFKEYQRYLSYTPESTIPVIEGYLYDSDGNLIDNRYPGYFILNKTLLGNEVL